MGDARHRPADVGEASPAARPGSAFSFAGLAAVRGFAALVDPSAYVPLPDAWVIGLTDVVTSTEAIAAGRYKAVNTAGAAVISAVANALGRLDFPFVFGGDGASFAVGPEDADRAREALAATVSWVGRELDLELRGAVVSVAEIRAAGHDVTVARFAASDDVSYAMFSGGGRAWAEGQLKNGRLRAPTAPPDARPDLHGLSCRFEDIAATNGLILSLIVRPQASGDPLALDVLGDIVKIAGRETRASHPVPLGGPRLRWTAASFAMEAKLQRRPGWPALADRLVIACRTALIHAIFRGGFDIGRFSPARYRRQMVDNSDFRKFDDGLMMTLDCTPRAADEIETRLRDAERAGLVRFGMHRQSSALLTCVVPSAIRPDHIHFVDGAAGGYAMAARDLKTPSV